MGSSPQVRGRRRDRRKTGYRRGLIPAGAGQTSPGRGLRVPRWAHPRRCGADSAAVTALTAAAGSSPQVRGRPRLCRKNKRRTGLIPAGAGQTRRDHLAYRWCAAHPRRCGADRPRTVSGACANGSSPQVRGRPIARRGWRRLAGLIPAGAGQTLKQSITKTQQRAHPRRCGADVWERTHITIRRGSSPQVRGRPFATSNAAPIERVKEPTSSSHF